MSELYHITDYFSSDLISKFLPILVVINFCLTIFVAIQVYSYRRFRKVELSRLDSSKSVEMKHIKFGDKEKIPSFSETITKKVVTPKLEKSIKMLNSGVPLEEIVECLDVESDYLLIIRANHIKSN